MEGATKPLDRVGARMSIIDSKEALEAVILYRCYDYAEGEGVCYDYYVQEGEREPRMSVIKSCRLELRRGR